MNLKFYPSIVTKGLVLLWIAGLIFSGGCYRHPSAQSLEYEANAVQALRIEINSINWDE